MKNDSEFVTGKIKMSVRGVPTEMALSIPTNQVKPQRMLPVIQKMANTLVDISVDEETAKGKEISCQAGCGACCSQVVPISKIEAYQIARLIRQMPALKKQKLVRRFEDALTRLNEIGWFEKLGDDTGLKQQERRELGIEYFRQNIPCPFLEDQSCSIHPDRPIACREYLVTSPAENCSTPTEESIDVVDMPIRLSINLQNLSKINLPDGESGYIPLISALKWTTENPDPYPNKSGEEWLGIILKDLAPKDQKNGPSDKA